MPVADERAALAQNIPDIDKLPDCALLTRAQLVPLLGVSLPTLKRWSSQGRGPKISRVEKLPRFRVGDVREWLAEARADA